MDDDFFKNCSYRVYHALRRIIKSLDVHSRGLNNKFNITTPQMLCLCSLARRDGITLSELGSQVNFGASTLNGIIDRLEAKELTTRTRSTEDRRKVLLHITSKGREMAEKAPSLLQDKLNNALNKLPELEQLAIAMSLERIVDLMNSEDIGVVSGSETELPSHSEIQQN